MARSRQYFYQQAIQRGLSHANALGALLIKLALLADFDGP